MPSTFDLIGTIDADTATRFESFCESDSRSCRILTDSVGGNVMAARKIVERIASDPQRFSAYVLRCHSMASYVAISCGRVVAGSNAVIGFHCTSSQPIGGNRYAYSNVVEGLRSTDRIVAEALGRRMGVPVARAEHLLTANNGQGVRLTAQEALQMHIIDSVDDAAFFPKNAIFRLWDVGPIGINHPTLESAVADARRRNARCRIVWRAPGMADWDLAVPMQRSNS